MGMMTCEFTFNGKTASEMGVTVEGFPGSTLPKRSYSVVQIPGRNGDLLQDNDSFENVTLRYTMHWLESQQGAVGAWLCEPGYHRLEDSLHPNHYREAFCMSSIAVSNRAGVLHRGTFEFSAKPQSFRLDGETKRSAVKGGTITNPGQPSEPIITVKGSGSGSLTIGGKVIQISDIPANNLIINCDIKDCYTSLFENKNSVVTMTAGFPVIPSGDSVITWSGGVTSVEYIPRWWDLI